MGPREVGVWKEKWERDEKIDPGLMLHMERIEKWSNEA